ncbi:MAG TPA: PhzF family phenazine biosynthesis protein [Polyangiaceae bacterium]|nr:PhzF family phenazine biosynthesis protein [Polyangiaceae bacterium]
MKRLPYRLCDVFTDRPLAGNALAVFTDAAGLDTDTMQQLARERNLSECAFVLPPRSPVAHAGLRIFTPTQELPFAGHPTLGTAFVLAEEQPQLGQVIRLATQRGVSTIEFSGSGAGPRFGWMTQPLPLIRAYEPRARLLAALGVEASTLPIELYDNGPHYVLVELDDPTLLGRLRPDMGELAALGSIAVTVTARLAGERWKTRVFAPGEGIPEDPATGAAAGPTALHLARHGRIGFGDTIVIEQGLELGRPSTLHARVFGSAEQLERVEVGGHAVVIGRGELMI